MAEQTTFIKVDRNIRTWRWFRNPNTLLVWLWLLTSANIEPHDFEKETIGRGELATSYKSIATNTGLTIQEVRTALGHLKSTGEITVRIRPRYQVISIVCYDRYQANQQAKQQADNRVSTGYQQAANNNQRSKKKGKEGKDGGGATTTTVPPSAADVSAYCQAHGIQTDVAAFIAYNAARGWKRGRQRVEDWQPLLEQWVALDAEYSMNQQDGQERDDFGRPVRKEFQ